MPEAGRSKEQLHREQRPQTQHPPEQVHDLPLAQRLRHALHHARQLPCQLAVLQLLQAGPQVLPQQVHLALARVAPADQLQDWQLHVQDVEEQQVSQCAESAQVRLDVACDGSPQGLACGGTAHGSHV